MKKKKITDLQANHILDTLYSNDNKHTYQLELLFQDFEIDCIIQLVNKEYTIEVFAPLYNGFKDTIILINTCINIICEKSIEIDNSEPIVLSDYQLTNISIKHCKPVQITNNYKDDLPF